MHHINVLKSYHKALLCNKCCACRWKPLLLTFFSMPDFKSPSGCTDHFCISVQSSNSAGDAVNKIEQRFVLCYRLLHQGFVFCHTEKQINTLGLSRIHRTLCACLACRAMNSGSTELMRLAAAYIRAALSINFSLMVAAEEKHSVFMYLQFCCFLLIMMLYP